MKYSFIKLYIAKIQEGIYFRIMLSVMLFGIGSLRTLTVTDTTTGEVILSSNILAGVLSLLVVVILFAILRSIMVGLVIYGCHQGHKGLQQTYKEFVGGKTINGC
jgi:hypothetical protein